MTTYTWLFFDADDTLFDFGRAEGYALSATFSEIGISAPPEALPAYHRFNLEAWHELEQGLINPVELRVIRFRRLFAHLGLSCDVERFSQRYLVQLAEGSFLLPGAKELLDGLNGRYRLGLITNGLPEVQRPRLEKAGIAGRFAFAAISEEIGVAKPDPQFFRTALEMAGRPDPRTVLVIGDSLTSDIQGGLQAGLDTLWYNPARKPADPRWPATYEMHALAEIAQWLA